MGGAVFARLLRGGVEMRCQAHGVTPLPGDG
jgi:hypothetical protein